MDEQDVPSQDMSLGDAVATLMQGLPAPIQDFLRGPERDKVILSLSQKYQLHADQAGDFERALVFMMLGISTPEEFTQALRDSGVQEEAIRSLTTDVNDQIFKPLRKAEQESGIAPHVETAPMPAVAPVSSMPNARPTQSFAPASVAAPVYATMPTSVSVPAPAPMAASAPTPAPAAQPISAPTPIYSPRTPGPIAAPLMQGSVPLSTPTEPQSGQSFVRTMAMDMQTAKHPEASVQAAPSHTMWPAAPASANPASPARSFQTASVPSTAYVAATAQPTVPLPGQSAPPNIRIPSQPVPPIPTYPTGVAPIHGTSVAPAPFGPPAASASSAPHMPTVPSRTLPNGTAQPLIKEYGVDPYREPVE